MVANPRDLLGLDKVHLQWFAEDDAETQPDEGQVDDANTDDSVAEIKKQLEAEKKRAAGNDKKVSELLSENKKLKELSTRETERKRKIAESKSLTVEDWQREFDKKVDEMELETQRRIAQIEEENKQTQYVQNIYSIAPTIENLPSEVASDVIKLLTVPKDADKDTLTEIMQTFADKLNAQLAKHKLVLENKGRLGSRPGTGGISSKDIPSDKEWEKYSYEDKKSWVHYATDEQLKKAQDKGLNI